MVRLEPRKELEPFAVAFALAVLKIRSVVPVNVGVLDQLVTVENWPEVVPVQV